MERMTVLEAQVIEAALNSDYNAGSGMVGEDAIDNDVWSFSVLDGLNRLGVPAPSHGGAIGSAIKKGFLTLGTHEKKDDVMAVTREGLEAFLSAGGVAPGMAPR